MIIKYENFISESKFEDIESEYHSIGEYIESVCKGDDYLLKIVSNYIKDVDVSVDISNAVNILEDFDKKQLFYRIYNYINSGSEKEKDPEIMTNIVFENANLKAGKNVFLSFLKGLTALGLKSIDKVKSPPQGYLFYYNSKDISVSSIKSVFGRFKSLSMLIGKIEYIHDNSDIFYGIKNDLTFEYGFCTEGTIIPIGDFKITNGILNWLMLLQSASALSLKRDLIHMDVKKMILFGRITAEVPKLNINTQQKEGPLFNDGVVSFGYYGIGKWDGGKLEDESFTNIKNNFKNFLSKYKWSEQILVSISYNSFWVYLNIKLKS